MFDRSLARVHATFALPGVQQAFFTKWLQASRDTSGSRAWQPLILDSRVYATLNETLPVTTTSIAGSHNRAARSRRRWR